MSRKTYFATEDIADVYEFEMPAIGAGAFGKVYKATHKESKMIRAIKEIRKSKLVNLEKTIIGEVENLKKLDHPNIIKVYECY